MRAGTSVRSIFQHFSEDDSLTSALLDELSRRFGGYQTQISAEGPFRTRLKAFVNARTTLLQQLTPHRRAGNLLEPFSSSVAQRRAVYRQRLRQQVETVFAPELAALPASRRADCVVAVTVIADWETWEALWRQTGADLPATRRILRQMLARQLGAD